MNLPLADAAHLAAHILKCMRPYCQPGRIKVAGSIRRRRPFVHDIDIVCIPLSMHRFKARVGQRCQIRSDGHYQMTAVTKSGIQVDFFFPQLSQAELFGQGAPCTWGSVLLCRTGPVDFNRRYATAAKLHDMRWNPNEGLVGPRGNVLASETEQDMFDALGIHYLQPWERR
jgi:DNA polymerase/3'-5' exonuclease PolX